MDTINDVELRDESIYPDEEVLRRILGESFAAYEELLDLYDRRGLTVEWRYYRDGKAWLCKVQKKAKTIVWMSAWKGFIQATVYLPSRYLESIVQLDISEAARERIMQTRDVGKSKPCIFEIHDSGDIEDLNELMEFKFSAK